VKIPNLLLDRCSGGIVGRVFLQYLMENRLVVLEQLVEPAPGGLVGRDRIAGHPAAAGELVKIRAGINLAVKSIDIKRRRLGRYLLLGSWCLGLEALESY